jgi:hypothetical protein
MRLTAYCLSLLVILAACRKESNDNSNGELLGRYAGTFVRTGMDTAQVNIFFKDDKTFEGSSDHVNYPALCSGSFDVSGSSIQVNDTCTWTANFDWTLIFDGNYSISYGENNTVRIHRTTGNITDEYRLTRFSR